MTCLAPCFKPQARVQGRLARNRPRDRQRGNMLLEAMVGMVIGASLSLGMAYGAARALAAQRYATTQSMAVFSMREKLATSSAVSGSGNFALDLNNVDAAGNATTKVTKTLSYTLTCSKITPTITFASIDAQVTVSKPCSMSTRSDEVSAAVLGGSGVVSFGP